MNHTNIDNLPEAVKNKQLTKREAANIIWEEIYTNPQKFGLFTLSEDQKSDFLLGLYDVFEKLFDKFTPGAISFQTFISGCLANYKMAFLRQQLDRETEWHTISSFLKAKSEEESQKYEIEVEKVAEDGESDCSKNFFDITHQTLGCAEKRNKRITELTALILALKACKDIDDDIITQVSLFTGIDKSLLYTKIQELKNSIKRKDEVNQEIVHRRNNAFFFHRKYMQEMASPSSTERRLRELQQKYEKQTKKWETHNKRLSVRSNSPSNEEIAKAIGIKPRTVSFYINHARNGSFKTRIQRLYQDKAKAESETTELSEEIEPQNLKVAEIDENQ